MLHFTGPRLVSFHDDPVTWARSLPRNLTSPTCMPWWWATTTTSPV